MNTFIYSSKWLKEQTFIYRIEMYKLSALLRHSGVNFCSLRKKSFCISNIILTSTNIHVSIAKSISVYNKFCLLLVFFFYFRMVKCVLLNCFKNRNRIKNELELFVVDFSNQFFSHVVMIASDECSHHTQALIKTFQQFVRCKISKSDLDAFTHQVRTSPTECDQNRCVYQKQWTFTPVGGEFR